MFGDHLQLRPIQAKALICALGLLVFVIDMVVPADLGVAIFYSFVVVLCASTRSLKFPWITTVTGVFSCSAGEPHKRTSLFRQFCSRH